MRLSLAWKNAGSPTRARRRTSVARSEHEFLLPSWRVRRVDHLRSVKIGSKGRWAKLLRAGQSLACLLLLLVILRVFGQGLLMGVAGAALVLLLQEAVDPTPLFWTAPWEAMQLLLSRARRTNHIWLHRTQELARESIGLSTKVDGFAMADGFVLIGVGSNKQLVRWTAEAAWRGIVRVRERARHSRGCKAVRFLIAVWLMTGSSAYTECLARNRSADGSSDRCVFRGCGTRLGAAY